MADLASAQIGSWFQQGPGNASSSLGKVSDQPLTYATPTQVVVAVGSTAILATSTAITRTYTLFIPANAAVDANGYAIFINPAGAAATTSHFGIPAGGSVTLTSLQAVNGIRAGSSDVTIMVLAGSVT